MVLQLKFKKPTQVLSASPEIPRLYIWPCALCQRVNQRVVEFDFAVDGVYQGPKYICSRLSECGFNHQEYQDAVGFRLAIRGE